jgi:hypothetical protein
MSNEERIADLEERVMLLETFIRGLTPFDTNIKLDGQLKPVSLLIIDRTPPEQKPPPFTILPHAES